jgi:hypothetical protein
VTFGGVPVPGATVTATQGDKNLVAITNEMGAYAFPDLPEGTWTIEVEMLGFATLKGDTSTAAWDLKMLPVEEMKAEVAHNEPSAPAPEAAAPAVSASNAKPNSKTPPAPPGQRTGFQRTQVNESANGNSQPASAQAQPASSAFANVSQEELNNRASDSLQINGTVNNGASSPFAQLAGFGNNRRGLRPLYNGGFAAAVDNSALDAHPYSLNGADTPRPSFNKGTYSFNFGGPMKIPGLIKNNGPNFFLGLQRVQNRSADVKTGRMPTEAERNGDLSDLGGGIVISPDQISPQARSLLQYFPLPNSPGNSKYNYQTAIVNVTHSDSVQTRINKAINQRNQLFGDFALQNSRSDAPNIFNFLDTGRTFGLNTSINWTTRPTQRFSATFAFRFSRLSTRNTPYFANHLNVSGIAGVTGNNQDPVNWGPPTLNLTGGTASLTDGLYSNNRNQTSSVSYNSFWNHGKHNVTFGADMRRQQVNILSQQDPRGTFTFLQRCTSAIVIAGCPSPDAPPPDPTTPQPPPPPGLDLAHFLLGIPDTSSIAFGNADKYFRQTFYDGFVTDDWRVNGALTLNGGIRWEYETPINEKYARLVNLSVNRDFSSAAPVVGNDLVHSDRIGFQPRVAFAWRPIAASSLIVRGNWGIYRNTNVYQSIAVQMAQQSPLSTSLSVQNSTQTPLFSLRNGFVGVPGVTQTTFAIDPNFRIGYAQNWMLSVQRDLPAALQMTAIYLGTKGTRLPQEFLPNTFAPNTPVTGVINPSGYIYLSSNGNSTREAGQIQLRRRLRSGFTSTIQYTYAKAIDDAPLMAGGQVATVNQAGTSVAQNWLNLAGERALSNFDQRHQLGVQAQYTSGSGVRGGALLSGWKGALLKEWTLAEAFTIGSGTPQTPIYFAAQQGSGVTGNLRPDLTGADIYAAPKGFHLNRAAFQPPPDGRFGNAARNSIKGPAQFSLNASLGRTFPWGDRYNVDLRVDATNVLNRATFKSWNTTLGNEQFGLPATVDTTRVLQTTLRVRF